jgi:hypothetical protein
LYEEDNSVHFFRHVIALDEHRVRFLPTFSAYGLRKPEPESVPEQPEHHAIHAPYHDRQESSLEHEHATNSSGKIKTDVKEVFFAGVHCGKYSSSGRLNTVTNLSFYRRWWRLCS